MTRSSRDPEPLRKNLVSGRKKSPSTRLKWYESWIIRAATVATLTLGSGYAVSAYFTFASISAIAKLAHDPAIEETLGHYLEHLKNTHTLRNELMTARLVPHARETVRRGRSQLTKEEVSFWLKRENIAHITGSADISLSFISSSERTTEAEKTRLPIGSPAVPGSLSEVSEWVDRDHLRLLNVVVTFPRGPDYESFKTTEDLKQRYQMIGVRLEEEIRPTLVRASLVTLIVTFTILLSLLILMAQRFKKRLSTVIEGFSLWSEQNSRFRFAGHYGGELRLITKQFNTMADEVETNRQRSLYLEKIASWQVIARKLAHEIKNPLTPIQMMVSQLKRRYKGDDPAFAQLLDDAQSIISEEIQSLRRMVDDFAQFARLPEPRLRNIDLIQLVRRVIELQKSAYPKHEITFQLAPRLTLEGASIKVDDDLMRQVVVNLIKNAAEASEESPAKITVSLTAEAEDFIIDVRDDGPGIPSEYVGRIFEAYFTTKHTGPTPGMGLGLAVCQKIVMDHQGQLLVTSHPGDTVFTIRLPR